MLVFLLLELGLRLAGVGYPTSFLLSARIHGQPSLVQNDRFTWRFFGRKMGLRPLPLTIPEVKSPETVRLFVFGESAAYGDPQPEFGLPRMLEVMLAARYPGARFEVVNAAIVGINSHVILPIARDCAGRGGDIWVIYMGNNEVVGPFGAGTVFGPKAPGLALIRANLRLKTTRTGQWLDQLRERLAERPGAISEWRGMTLFVNNQVRQNDPRMATVYSHFERNLRDILRAGLDHGARIVVSSVASNLKDCAPFASLRRPDLSVPEREDWDKLYQSGTDAQRAGRNAEATDCFREAARIDDGFAELHFRWGQCCLGLGRDAEARRQFSLARDQDALRFRADSRLNEIIRKTASGREREGIFFVDGQESLERQSSHGLIGDELLYEHVHLKFEGNYLLARALAEPIAKLLPEAVARRGEGVGSWLSLSECARRLAWSDWSRYQAEKVMVTLMSAPPFTAQFNHTEVLERLRRSIQELQPAIRPEGLREAMARYREALVTSPQDWMMLDRLGGLQQEAGDVAGAVESCQRVTQLMPLEPHLRVKLAISLDSLGRHDEARNDFVEALRLDPDAPDAHFQFGASLGIHGDNAGALEQFEEAVRLKPQWLEARLNVAIALMQQHRNPEAIREFEEVLRLNPNNPIAQRHLQSLGARLPLASPP